MPSLIEATFDGQVFRPESPVTLPPHTRVWLQFHQTNGIDSLIQFASSNLQSTKPAYQSLRIAETAQIDGPSDWSNNLDQYLYGSIAPDDDHEQDRVR